MIWKLFITSSFLFLIACGSTIEREKPIEDVRWQTQWLVFDCGEPPTRDLISLAQIPEKFWEITAEGDYCLSSDEYALLGEIMQNIKLGSSQLRSSAQYYEDCIAAAKRVAAETQNVP